MKLGTLFVVLSLLAQSPALRAADDTDRRSSRHALVIIPGSYGNGLPKLPGTARDVEHAQAMARSLGVPEQQVRLLRDGEAGAEGIRRAASDLSLRIAPSDQILIYLSGLGGGQEDRDRPGGCEETFIAADGTPLGYGELAGYFLPAVERAEKTMVFIDSCSSAPDGERSLKARCLPSAARACRGNGRWRSLVTELRKAAVPTANIIGLTAAQPGQPAYEDTASGGVFSGALRRCLAGGETPDANGSGALSFSEVAACAQAEVNRRLPAGVASTMVMAGNAAYAPLKGGAGAGGEQSLLEDMYAGRDGRREVVLSASPGQRVSVKASVVGYLYLISAVRGEFSLLYPTAQERDNRLRAGSTFTWPPSGAAPGQGGALLALVTDNPRDTGMLPGAGQRPFAADAIGREAVRRFVTTSVRSNEGACREVGAARNLSLARACSDAYAAALAPYDSR